MSPISILPFGTAIARCRPAEIDMRGRLPATIGALAIFTIAGPARAAPPPIVDSKYTLDVFQGPVTSSSRVVGLAGAYTAVAEGCEGAGSNTASPAVRSPWSVSRWDYDICLDFTNPGAFSNIDFENHGPGYKGTKTRFSNAFTFDAGLELQYQGSGIGGDFAETRLGLGKTNVLSSPITVVLNRISGSVATGFGNGQFLVGVGLRAASLSIAENSNIFTNSIVSTDGIGFQVGTIIQPRLLPFRLGATFRSQIDITDVRGTSSRSDGAQLVNEKFLPNRVQIPWEVEVGGAVELGKRPLNPPRLDGTSVEDAVRARYDARRLTRAREYERTLAKTPEKEREKVRRSLERQELAIQALEHDTLAKELADIERAEQAEADLWSRGEIMLLTTVLVTGNTLNGVGVADMLAQEKVASGESIAISPRVALETELYPKWITARVGTYLEPARVAGTDSRGHATVGFDVRLFKFNPFGLFGDTPWRIRLAGDLAPRYVNYGIAIGRYH